MVAVEFIDSRKVWNVAAFDRLDAGAGDFYGVQNPAEATLAEEAENGALARTDVEDAVEGIPSRDRLDVTECLARRDRSFLRHHAVAVVVVVH